MASEPLDKLIEDAKANRWSIVGFIVGAVFGAIPLAIPFFISKDDKSWLLAATFTVCFFVYTLYIFHNFVTLSKIFKDYANLKCERNAAVEQNNKTLALLQRADEAFFRLCKHRDHFETDLLGFQKKEITADSWETEKKLLGSSLQSYLKAICDCAVDSLRIRKGAYEHVIESNIKLLKAGPQPTLHRYSVAARSADTREDRSNKDDPNKFVFAEKNGFFTIFINEHAGKHSVVDNDFEHTVLKWKNMHQEGMPEPDELALKYYKKVAFTPIIGKRFFDESDPRDQDVINVNNNLALVGMFFIDSPTMDFDSKHDTIVLEELAINAYLAIRAYHGAIDLARKRVYGT